MKNHLGHILVTVSILLTFVILFAYNASGETIVIFCLGIMIAILIAGQWKESKLRNAMEKHKPEEIERALQTISQQRKQYALFFLVPLALVAGVILIYWF